MHFLIRITSGATFDNFVTKPQLEIGTEITDFEPYQSTEITLPLTEPLRSIGDVKDEIVKQDGKWGVLRRIKKTFLNPNLDWQHSGTEGESLRFGAVIKETIISLSLHDKNKISICNMFKNCTLTEAYANGGLGYTLYKRRVTNAYVWPLVFLCSHDYRRSSTVFTISSTPDL